jgi:hypothetical protein
MDTSGIKRLGFEAWADNLFVDAFENLIIPGDKGEGWASWDGKDYHVHIVWNSNEITCSVRAWTEEGGWQEYSKTTQR